MPDALPAPIGDGGDVITYVLPEFHDLTFHRMPDRFLRFKASSYKVLGAILVDLWSEARHVMISNAKLMELTGMSRTAVKDALRDLEEHEKVITCFQSENRQRIIQLNFTLKYRQVRGEKFTGRMVDEPPQDRGSEFRPGGGRNSDRGRVGIPTPVNFEPVKESGHQGRDSDRGPVGIPTEEGRDFDRGVGRNSDPPSYLRDSNEKKRDLTRVAGVVAVPGEGTTTTPARGDKIPPTSEVVTPVQCGSEISLPSIVPPFVLAEPRQSRPDRQGVDPRKVHIELVRTDPKIAADYLIDHARLATLERTVVNDKSVPAELLLIYDLHLAAVECLANAAKEPRAPGKFDPQREKVLAYAAKLARGMKQPAVGPSGKNPDGRRKEPHP